jgi:hypothetical protein
MFARHVFVLGIAFLCASFVARGSKGAIVFPSAVGSNLNTAQANDLFDSGPNEIHLLSPQRGGAAGTVSVDATSSSLGGLLRVNVRAAINGEHTGLDTVFASAEASYVQLFDVVDFPAIVRRFDNLSGRLDPGCSFTEHADLTGPGSTHYDVSWFSDTILPVGSYEFATSLSIHLNSEGGGSLSNNQCIVYLGDAVPEPSSLVLLGLAACSLFAIRRSGTRQHIWPHR